MKIQRPYLLYTGDADASFGAKTAQGVLHWCPEQCIAQYKLADGQIDLGIPFMDYPQAYQAGARTVLLGVTNRGGYIPNSWIPSLVEALDAGFDLASGMHERLVDQPMLQAAAVKHKRQLHDIRHWSGENLPLATGNVRSGKRALMIGTDCAVGKKFSALAIHRAMRARGLNATFRATGQTGLLIAGEGIAIDAVAGDFIAGAVEMITPANSDDHWDVIEGQATVLHPSYAGVSVGLVHGAQPHAMILCHEPGRTVVRGLPHRTVPSLSKTIDAHVATAQVTNADAQVVGISLDTHRLDEVSARKAISEASEIAGIPATDPLRFGADILVDAIVATGRS